MQTRKYSRTNPLYQKKDVRLESYVHQLVGIAKRLNQMNNEETIFPRRDIHIGNV